MTATMGDPGSIIPVSFQLLFYELRWGSYWGQQLLALLQLLLLSSNRNPLLGQKTQQDLGTDAVAYGDGGNRSIRRAQERKERVSNPESTPYSTPSYQRRSATYPY